MTQFNWNLNIVAPEMVRAIKEEMCNAAESEKDYYERKTELINKRIGELIFEGREICYPGYSIPTFHFYTTGAGEARVGNGSCDRVCDAYAMAYIERFFEDIILTEHRHLINLYRMYDERAKDCFLSHEEVINELGGSILPKRPYIQVTLPIVDSLATETHTLACSKRNSNMLLSKITHLTSQS